MHLSNEEQSAVFVYRRTQEKGRNDEIPLYLADEGALEACLI